MAGTALALEIGSYVAPKYGIGDAQGYRREVWDAIFVPLRLRGVTSWSENDGWEHGGKNLLESVYSYMDLRCTFSDTYFDAAIEIATHPAFFHLIKSVTFITIIMAVSEVSARRKSDLTPRGVPKVITTSVVVGSLLVIFADWGFLADFVEATLASCQVTSVCRKRGSSFELDKVLSEYYYIM